MNCPNCGSQITCSCQIKVASNGAQVCTTCLVQYEKNLTLIKTTTR
jgi:transcription elongation factor Elf1